MNRYCEVKLVDIVKEDLIKKMKKRKHNPTSTQIAVKTSNEIETKKIKLSNNMVLLRRDHLPDEEIDLSNLIEKSARSSNNSAKNISNNYLRSNKNKILCENYQSTSADNISSKDIDLQTPRDLSRRKRKIVDENTSESLNTISFCTKSVKHSNNDNEAINQEKLNKRRKQRKGKPLWENKLTGARRVSKRLTNKRIQNLKKLVSYSDSNQQDSIEPRDHSVKKSMKISKVDSDQLRKNKMSKKNRPKNRKQSEQKTNFGKLGHTKKLYPRLASKRSTTFKVKKKSIDVPNLQSINLSVQDDIVYEDIVTEATENTRNSTNTNIPHGQSEEVSEMKEESKNEIYIQSNINCEVETAKEINSSEGSCIKILTETVLSDHEQKGSEDDSKIIIVDIESGENITCDQISKCEEFMTNSNSGDGSQTTKEKDLVPENLIVTVNSSGKSPDSHESLGCPDGLSSDNKSGPIKITVTSNETKADSNNLAQISTTEIEKTNADRKNEIE